MVGLPMAVLGLLVLRARDFLCDWHLSVFSCTMQPVAGRGEGVSPPQSVASHQSWFSSLQSALLPACANRAIAGTIRVLDPVILSGKEGARCDD